jgi:hypothetical protein
MILAFLEGASLLFLAAVLFAFHPNVAPITSWLPFALCLNCLLLTRLTAEFAFEVRIGMGRRAPICLKKH